MTAKPTPPLQSSEWLDSWKPIFVNGVIPQEFRQAVEAKLQEARIDEIKRLSQYIGDIHMERIGVPDIDKTTSGREAERQWLSNIYAHRLKELDSLRPRTK